MGLDNAPDAEVIDMTEVRAAMALLNGEEAPSDRVTVSASIFPLTEQINRKAAEKAAEEEIENAKPGDVMADGTIYLGRFKDKDGTEKHWLAAAEDAKDKYGDRLCASFNYAVKYAGNSKTHDHDDWIVPPGCNDREGRPDILSALFNSKSTGAFEGTYVEKAVRGWYCSSSPVDSDDKVRVQHFDVGWRSEVGGHTAMSLRLVRSVKVQGARHGA